jgi:hypothetical protein
LFHAKIAKHAKEMGSAMLPVRGAALRHLALRFDVPVTENGREEKSPSTASKLSDAPPHGLAIFL